MEVKEVIRMARSLEKDHEPYGWPSVRMREMTILADEVERLEKENADLSQELEYLKKDRECDAGTLNNLGKEFAKVKKQNKELVELVYNYKEAWNELKGDINTQIKVDDLDGSEFNKVAVVIQKEILSEMLEFEKINSLRSSEE